MYTNDAVGDTLPDEASRDCSEKESTEPEERQGLENSTVRKAKKNQSAERMTRKAYLLKVTAGSHRMGKGRVRQRNRR